MLSANHTALHCIKQKVLIFVHWHSNNMLLDWFSLIESTKTKYTKNMGKSYNRNQDKHNKYDRERQQRDRKNKIKNNGQRKSLTDVDDQFNVRNVFRNIYSDEASYW